MDNRTSIEFFRLFSAIHVFIDYICLKSYKNTVILGRSMDWERRSTYVYRSSENIC